ncbi:MAG: hypothetical protein NZM35_00335 [Chitinophagales bacterium]|nr:hypothetical protein [Chitinophagales bacterium]MDW8420171.1 hypothetical protein [Chitinophagales bacterium]
MCAYYYTCIVSLIICVTIYGCCTKRDCIGTDDLNWIVFRDFSAEELDSIKIYETGVLMLPGIVVDSMEIYNNPATYGIDPVKRILLPKGISLQYHYKVVLLSTGAVYLISDFEAIQDNCNTGFLCFDFYERLASYRVNGVKQNFAEIVIKR